MPEHIRESWQSPLREDEWHPTPIKTADTLTRTGGVAFVTKWQVAEVIARVGLTLRPTAIITTEPVRRFTSTPIQCTVYSVDDADSRSPDRGECTEEGGFAHVWHGDVQDPVLWYRRESFYKEMRGASSLKT